MHSVSVMRRKMPKKKSFWYVLKNSSGQRRQGCRPATRREERNIGLNFIALIPC
ncbi:hypothetical protein LOK49_Contig220G00006 [Camellia lanceoleosa]|nr:hypothetical protein LOK49_Contig220G00006 [Camellia lanceoleosa]